MPKRTTIAIDTITAGHRTVTQKWRCDEYSDEEGNESIWCCDGIDAGGVHETCINSNKAVMFDAGIEPKRVNVKPGFKTLCSTGRDGEKCILEKDKNAKFASDFIAEYEPGPPSIL